MLKTLPALLLALLPVAQLAAQEPNEKQRELIRVKQQQDENPLLRVNVAGHTGTVQALAFTPDGKRLCSAGLDKVTHVWNLEAAGRDLTRVYLKERTLRWQVARGLRGSIYSLAIAPNDGLLAVGGYGAMGLTGEILLVDPVSGQMTKLLGFSDQIDPETNTYQPLPEAHYQTIVGLAWSANGNLLASSDVYGQVVLWSRGNNWKPWPAIQKPDKAAYGDESAAMIQTLPKVRPIAIAGNAYLVYPVYVGEENKVPQWQLKRASLANLDQVDPKHKFEATTLDTKHKFVVSALAASADGKLLASADAAGKLYLWDLEQGTSTELKSGFTTRSLTFSPDGKTLVAGTLTPFEKQSQLQIWDVATKKILRTRNMPDDVNAVAVSPDNKQVAYSGSNDNQVTVEWLAGDDNPARLKAPAGRIWKVAFARQEPLYRVAFATEPRAANITNELGELNETFDPVAKEWQRNPNLQEADWVTPEMTARGWLARYTDRRHHVLQLYQGQAKRGLVTTDLQTEGAIRCFTWINDAQGRPFAIAVGTDQQNHILVYRIVNQGQCPVLRLFRGHNDYVTSLSVSVDLRYLASSSADGTIRFWSLRDLQLAAPPRWGASFDLGQELKVTDINAAGPLYRRGLRKGDVISEMRWYDGGVKKSNDPAEMYKVLTDSVWGKTQISIKYARDNAVQVPFQIVLAWQPVATLFMTDTDEWAFFTPEGYYDASTNGHTIFGWQVNRGIKQLPDFYRADQFRKRLERADVLEQLLPAGNLPAAFDLAKQKPPARMEHVLVDQIAAAPRVQIVSPKAGTVLAQAATKVQAKVQVPDPNKTVNVKVFANGVAGTNRRVVKEEPTPFGVERTYEWDLALPADQRAMIQVFVATDAPTSGFNNVLVSRAKIPQPAEPPRLFVLSVGVNTYKDKNIQALDFSVADAQAVLDTLESHTSGLYHVEQAKLLKNEQVTRAKWKESITSYTQELQQKVRPNDVFVLFLAGHGFIDPETQNYYYASYDLKMEDFVSGSYGQCISWEDFRPLADIPCRKLAMLDTCHSGAIQPLRQRNLKAAIREFQDDVVFTVTASRGYEKSAENPDWGHGAFTKCLLEALSGKADQSADGVVSLTEAIAYVKREVPILTNGGQHPTAGPDELFPYISLGLTKTGAE